jgi:hypothetical protein
MSGVLSIVEFDAEVSIGQQRKIVAQLDRSGVTIEVIPLEERHE